MYYIYATDLIGESCGLVKRRLPGTFTLDHTQHSGAWTSARRSDGAAARYQRMWRSSSLVQSARCWSWYQLT